MENKFPRQGHHSRGGSAVAIPVSRSWALQDPVSCDGAGRRRWGLTQFSTLKPFYSAVIINFVLYFAA